MFEKSTHKVEVVPIKLRPHPNADRLAICDIYGYQCIVGKDDFQDGDRAAYIVPDSIVDTSRPEFAFLGDHPRIRVKKLRGQISHGLLVKAPAGAKLGDDVAEILGVTHYEPPVKGESGSQREKLPVGPFYKLWLWKLRKRWHQLRYVRESRCEQGPFTLPKYDVDAWRRYNHLFADCEPVVVTEKIHGANARYVVVNGRLYVGSRTEWKKDPHAPRPKLRFWQKWIPASCGTGDWWWQAIAGRPEIAAWLHAHPHYIVYGEVFGAVQGGFNYGLPPGQVDLRLFDIKAPDGRWLDFDEAQALAKVHGPPKGLPWVPVIYRGPYDKQLMQMLADGPSTLPGAKHVREGVVIKPLTERASEEIGRVQLKLVSDQYYALAA